MAYYNYMSSMPTTRVSGMVSGMDTDSIIKGLMEIEQLKVDKVYREKTKVEWENEALREINNLIRDFRNTYMSALGKENMFTSNRYKAYKVDADTNRYVDIKANSNAFAGNHTIDYINQLAEGAKLESNKQFSDISNSTKLIDLGLFDEDGNLEFSINGEVFSGFDENTTVQDFLNKINNSKANVTMTFSSLSGKFTIVTKETGEQASLTIENEAGNAFGENSVLGITETTANGIDAELSIDGYIVKRSSNTFSIDGITYTLKKTTPENYEGIDFTVSQDVDYTVDSIVKFINAYNELVGKLTDKLYEEVHRGFPPLTQAQKEAMESEDIAKWEEKAKSGILRNNSKISSLVDKMRSFVYKKVEGVGLSLSDIGITTGSYKEKGKLVIDEDTLRKSITENPDAVLNLFMKSSNATDSTQKMEEQGFIRRLMDAFSTYTGSIDFSKYSEAISDYDKKMDELMVKMWEKQESYYAKFAAMERALSEMYSQSQWLAQQAF